MENNRFNFCPECGSKKIQTLLNGRQWFCPDCGLELFNNVASAVGVILENEKHEILFEKDNVRKAVLERVNQFLHS